MMIEFFRNEYSIENRSLCYFEDNLSFISNLHKRKLGHDMFWETVLSHLILENVEIVEKDNCSETGFRFIYDMWFPSSKTLRSDYGLEFENDICLDNRECRNKLADKLASNDVNYIMED